MLQVRLLHRQSLSWPDRAVAVEQLEAEIIVGCRVLPTCKHIVEWTIAASNLIEFVAGI